MQPSGKPLRFRLADPIPFSYNPQVAMNRSADRSGTEDGSMDPAPRVSSSSGNSSIARYVPLTAVTLVGLSLSLYLFHAAGA